MIVQHGTEAHYMKTAIYFIGILQCEGQDIQWMHLKNLYKRNRPITESPSLAMIHKIKFEHVNLTAFSKMRVDLAAQVNKYMQYHIFVYLFFH